MITADDLEFHTPPDGLADHKWAETGLFPIVLPDEHLLIMVYVCVRPHLGVMSQDVFVCGALSENRAELIYLDQQNHLPAPERFSRICTPAGLELTAVDPPHAYRIDYVGIDDTEIHVDWVGVMDPFDVHDPDHTPHAVGSHAERVETSGFSKAWNGHFDMTGHVTGTVKIRGRELDVDSYERMDHSWGVRGEMDLVAMDSISAQFGADLAFHLIVRLDLDAPGGADQTLAHGYVLQDGVRHGVQALDIATTRLGSTVVAMQMTVTDVRGEVFELHAVADVGVPWSIYTTLCHTGLMTWVLGDRVGYGVVMEVLPMAELTRRRGRWWTDPPSALATG